MYAYDTGAAHLHLAGGDIEEALLDGIGDGGGAVLDIEDGAALAVAHRVQVVHKDEEHFLGGELEALAGFVEGAEFGAGDEAAACVPIQRADLQRATELHLAIGSGTPGEAVEPDVIEHDDGAGPAALAGGAGAWEQGECLAHAFAGDGEGSLVGQAADEVIVAPARGRWQAFSEIHALIAGYVFASVPHFEQFPVGGFEGAFVPGCELGEDNVWHFHSPLYPKT